MNELQKQIKIHFIDINTKSDKVIAIKTEYYVPRVGDEIRLSENLFYKVEMVVWIYDEPMEKFSRVNIGVSKVEL